MMYNTIVEDCFFFPKHVGVLNLSEPRTVYFTNNQFSKDVLISFYMQCDSNKIVNAVSFKTNGNPYVIASLECLCRQTVGKKLEQLYFNYEDLIKLLEIPYNQAPVIFHVQEAYKEVLILMNKKIEGES